MEGKYIDKFVKQSIDANASKKHPSSPDIEDNWATIEAVLKEDPNRRKTIYYVAAAAIALLLFSNFYWMFEQHSHKEQITAIVFEYEEKLAKEPPVAPDPKTAPEPELAPEHEAAPDPDKAPEPEIKIVYMDRYIEVPVEVPVHIQPEEAQLAEKSQEPGSLQPELNGSAEPTIKEEKISAIEEAPDRKDLLPPTNRSSKRTKNSKNKKNHQRSFGLTLALKQN